MSASSPIQTDLLARASDMPDFATLEASLQDTLQAVHEAFDRIVA